MASHKGWDRTFPVNSVATSGGSFNIAKGQLALINLDATPVANGLKIISSVAGLPKDTRFQLRVGKHEIQNNRSQSSKDWSTETFKLSSIVDLKVDAPSADFKTDSFVLGWDGFNDDSAIVLANGDNEEISLTLKGLPMGMIGYQDSQVEIKAYLGAPNSGAFTNQEIVENAVKFYNNYLLYGQVPLSNYVDVVAVNSENTALTGADKFFYTLILEDDGDSNALAAVQSQYNDYKVVRTFRDDAASTYTIIGDAGSTITSGAFVVGQQYVILTAGTTDYTLIGAADSEVGTIFTATGVGTGTGTATENPIADFSKSSAWKIKGCAVCPPGYSAFTDGWIYSVALEDDGADSTAAVEAISANAEASSAVAVSVVDGVTTYTFINSEALTDAEIAAFIASEPSAVIELVAKDVQAVCSPDAVTTTAWIIEKTCKVTTEAYSIILADDECGVGKLAAIQAHYPELTIAQGTSANCQTQYTTSVVSNVVCEDCADTFRALFETKAPGDYENKPWTATDKTYSATAKMGIKFTAKKVVLSGSEVYRDDMPFIASSVRLALAGGYITNYSESFSEGSGNRFAVTVLSIGTEPENLGASFREWEDIMKRYQEGVSRHEGNNFAKWALGEETLFEAMTPQVDYILTIKNEMYAQSFAGTLVETFYYHFTAPLGKHVAVETLLNALAAGAGVNPVQAFAKD